MKKYLNIRVTNHRGDVFSHHLKLSEAHFISQLAQENKYLVVRMYKCDSKTYKSIFE